VIGRPVVFVGRSALEYLRYTDRNMSNGRFLMKTTRRDFMKMSATAVATGMAAKRYLGIATSAI